MALSDLESSFMSSFGDDSVGAGSWDLPNIETPKAPKHRDTSQLATNAFSPLTTRSAARGRVPFSDVRNRQQPLSDARNRQQPLSDARNRQQPLSTSGNWSANGKRGFAAGPVDKENLAYAFAPKADESFYNATEHDFDADMSSASSLPNFSILKSPDSSFTKSSRRQSQNQSAAATARVHTQEGLLTASDLGATDSELGFGTQDDFQDVLARDEALFDANVSRIDANPSSPFAANQAAVAAAQQGQQQQPAPASESGGTQVGDRSGSQGHQVPGAGAEFLSAATAAARARSSSGSGSAPYTRDEGEGDTRMQEGDAQIEGSSQKPKRQQQSRSVFETPSRAPQSAAMGRHRPGPAAPVDADVAAVKTQPAAGMFSARKPQFPPGMTPSRYFTARSGGHGGMFRDANVGSPHMNNQSFARTPAVSSNPQASETSSELHHPVLERPSAPPGRRPSRKFVAEQFASNDTPRPRTPDETPPDAAEKAVKTPMVGGMSYGDPASLMAARQRILSGDKGRSTAERNASESPSPRRRAPSDGFASHVRMTDSVSSSFSSSSNTSHASYASSHASYQANPVGLFTRAHRAAAANGAAAAQHSSPPVAATAARNSVAAAGAAQRKPPPLDDSHHTDMSQSSAAYSYASGVNPLNYSHHSDMTQASAASSHASFKRLPEDRTDASIYNTTSQTNAVLTPTYGAPAAGAGAGTASRTKQVAPARSSAAPPSADDESIRRELDFSRENVRDGSAVPPNTAAESSTAAGRASAASATPSASAGVEPLSISQIDNTVDFASGRTGSTISMSPLVKFASPRTSQLERLAASHSSTLGHVDTRRPRADSRKHSTPIASDLALEEKTSETPVEEPAADGKQQEAPHEEAPRDEASHASKRSVSFVMDRPQLPISTPRPMTARQQAPPAVPQSPSFRTRSSAHMTQTATGTSGVAAGFQPTQTPTRDRTREATSGVNQIRTPVSMLKERGGGRNLMTTPSRPKHRAKSPPPGTPLTPVHHTVNSSIARFDPQKFLLTPGNRSSGISSAGLMSPWVGRSDVGSPDSRMSEFRPSESLASSEASLSIDRELGITMRDGVAVNYSEQVRMCHRFVHFEVDTAKMPVDAGTRDHLGKLAHKLAEKAFRVPNRPRLVHAAQQGHRKNWFTIMFVVPVGILDVERPVERPSGRIGDIGIYPNDNTNVAEWVAAFWETFTFAKDDGAHFTSLEPTSTAGNK